MRVQRSVEIAAPPERVWPFLVEPNGILKWCITFRRFDYVGDQRSGVGTPIYIEEKVDGPLPLMRLNFEVTEWVEKERLAFRMTSGAVVRAYEQSWTIESTDSGSRFTFFEEVELPFGILGRIIGLIGQRSSNATVGKMLAILKDLVEGKAEDST
jgi:uncharacterized protein YndB with AHSA1/START domain